MQNHKRFQNKCALITGASRGIGAAIAMQLADEGAHVIIQYRDNQQAAAAIANDIKLKAGKATIIEADVRDQSSVEKLFDEIKSKSYEIDYLVNNAGITRDGLFGAMELEDWNSVIQTNLYGTYYTSRKAIRQFMAKRSGKIVNISSVSGIYGAAGQTNYASSKAAIIALTKSLAKEVGKFNINVNAVAPGFIETDMLMELPLQTRRKLPEKSALARIGKPSEVADVVLFLLSNQSTYIQGQTIIVDGCIN